MATPSGLLIENYSPYVANNGGINTNKPVLIGSDLTVTGTTNIAGVSLTDLTVTGNTVIGNTATDTLAVTGVSTFVAGAATDAVTVTGAAITTGSAFVVSDLALLTSGFGLEMTSSATAITGVGRMVLVNHTGATTTSGTIMEVASAATDETIILQVTASGVNALGSALTVTTATTTGSGVAIVGNALTTGAGISVTSSATAITTTGRLGYFNHTGVTTTSGTLVEVASAANDETIVFQVTASAANALGVASQVTTATTTGMGLNVIASSLTTGTAARVYSDSADTTARNLLAIVNDNTAATGAIPLFVQQDALVSTNFKLVAQFAGINVYISNQNSPNTALSAPEGSICLNASATGQIAYNNDGATSWQIITSA